MTQLNESEVVQFLKDLLDPDMYGFAVTAEVRQRAKQLLESQKEEVE
jgi:PleD family two-component response regulator